MTAEGSEDAGEEISFYDTEGAANTAPFLLTTKLNGADAFGERTSTLRHPGLDPGSSAIKSLIARDSFHGADAPWLDAGSSPA